MTLPSSSSHPHGRINSKNKYRNRNLFLLALFIGIIGFLFLCCVFILSFWLPTTALTTNIRGKHSKTPTRQEHYRLALIIPYSRSQDTTNNLPYWNVFCYGAAGIASVADVLVFYTGGSLDHHQQQQCPPNVHFINLQSERGMAERLWRVTDNNNNNQEEEEEEEEVLEMLTTFIKIHPYGLVEFKPALGHIFADYLIGYSHWGYTDIDVLFGDLSGWITADEWTEYDIVTYSYGDQHRLYARGQFTFHKNDPVKINQIWRDCSYLTGIVERFRDILNQKQHYHTESAEGCYSAAILSRTDLRVKYAVKAWTDTQDTGGMQQNVPIPTHDTFHTHGVYIARNPQTGRQVLYQAKSAGENAQHVSRLTNSWLDDYYTSAESTLLQRDMGALELVDWDPTKAKNEKTDNSCMYWVLPTYQSKICAAEPIAPDENVYWIDGKLYKQRFENINVGDARTGPFFHFQEWKRHYRFGQLASMHWTSQTSAYLLTDKGAFPLESGDYFSNQSKANSPLGLSPLGQWRGIHNHGRSQLPWNSYCVMFELDSRSNAKLSCKAAAAWFNENVTDILVEAPGWNGIDIEKDVTLVLTMQINAALGRDSLTSAMDHFTSNVESWYGQPCVAILFLTEATKESVATVYQRLGRDTAFASRHPNLLLAAIYNDESSATTTLYGRKALLNMAIDAVPTRWYIAGLELERGLVLSSSTKYLATRVADTYGSSRANMFFIPQFGLVTNDEIKRQHPVGLDDLVQEHDANRVRPLAEFDRKCNVEPERTNTLKALHDPWWQYTTSLLEPPKQELLFSSLVETLQDFETRILEHAVTEGHNVVQEKSLLCEDESPILLIDNAAPINGILANELVREIEELDGFACYNTIKLTQLITLGYRLSILPGAFAASTETSRQLIHMERCRGCSSRDESSMLIMEKIVHQEIRRIADMSILSTF